MPSSPSTELLKDKIAIVTGTSSGIGLATAELLAANGSRVVLVARRAERLQELHASIQANGGKSLVLPMDLTQEDSRYQLFEQVIRAYGRIDILINNAGFGWYGYFHEMPWKTAYDLIQLNMTAVAHLTRLVLPGMLERNHGHIINVGSIVGSIPTQGVVLYSSSKSFIDAFSKSLHRELRGSLVRLSNLRVGPVKTAFFQAPPEHQARQWIPVEQFGITPEHVASRILSTLRQPRSLVYIPRYMVLIPWVELFFGWLADSLGPVHLKRSGK
jgi:uncharacterized protein